MLKKIAVLLVGAYVAIMIVVGFVPSISGIVTTGLTSGSPVAEVLLKIAIWAIPLGAAFIIVLKGLSAFSKRRRARRSRRMY